MMISFGVEHSPQTRSFATAATLARVRLRNISQGLASTCAEASADRSPPLPAKPSEFPLLAHCVAWLPNIFSGKRSSFLASRRFAQEDPTPTLR